MSTQETRRSACFEAFRAGRTAKETSDFFNYPLRTVYDLKKRFDEEVVAGAKPEEVSPAHRAPKRLADASLCREKDVRSPDFVARVQEMIKDDPSKSIRSLAREMNVSAMTMDRTVHEDLGYKSYALQHGQLLTTVTKARRLDKAKKLLSRLKNPKEPHPLIFFSDEKNFTQNQKINRRNNRWLCSDPADVPVVMRSKFPSEVMVLGVVSNEGHIMPPHFFPKGLRICAKDYLEVLKDVVKPWMDQTAGGRHYIFQQDGAPAHTANIVQKWCKENLPEFWEKEIWPPSSPDCNPLDYYVWSFCEAVVNKQPHNTADSLRARIVEVMADLDGDTLRKACNRFRFRLQQLIDADGDFFE